ncbi:hypothetical protein WJX82_000800 [Trebouxia sp. C0006]
MPGRSKEHTPFPQAGRKPCLTEDIYNQALHQLSAGAMTAKELEIRVGRPGHLPLNIVDTPGLIINDVPVRPVVEEPIKTVLASQPDRPLLPIMTGTGNDVDINNLRTNLVRGRAFITVFTHVDHLMTDQPKVKGLRALIQQLNNMGCLRCFLVNVKDSVDWPEQKYQEFCQAHSEGSQAVYDELLSMCGIPRLLKELQKRQLDFMLSQRHQLLTNLTALARKLDVTGYPQGEKEVADGLGYATQVPTNFQANVQAARTLTRFTENAFNDALKAVMLGRSEEDIKILGNNTLMLNYHTHAWNKTIQGLSLVTNDDHADKATRLRLDFCVLSEELFYTLPSIQASQIYLFFESQQEQVTKLLGKEGDLVTALMHNSGTWKLPVALKPHNEEFQKELEVAQRRIKLLAFFAVSNLVENLNRRMTYIVFAKSYDVMAQSTWTGAPLTSFDLEAAFKHYFGNTNRHEEWIEPGQLQMQAKHDVVQSLLAALKSSEAQMCEKTQPPQNRPPHIVPNQVPEQNLQPLTPGQPAAQMHGGQGRQSYDHQQTYHSPHQQQAYQQGGYQQAPQGQGQANYAPQDYARAQFNMGNGRDQF